MACQTESSVDSHVCDTAAKFPQPYVPAYERLFQARKQISLALALGSPEIITSAYAEFFSLLPLAIYLHPELQNCVGAVREMLGVAVQAAMHALRLGETIQALEWLDTGRMLFWTRMLRIRIPYQGLPNELRERLDYLFERLQLTLEESNEIALEQRRLDEEALNRAAAEVRQTPGLENFLKISSYEQLRYAAGHGPVVLFVGDEKKSFAIIISSPEARAQQILLPAVNESKLAQINSSINQVIKASRDAQRKSLPNKPMKPLSPRRKDPLVSILAELWMLVLLPVMRALKLSKSASRPRLWLCPAGNFIPLPLHAAGSYTTARIDCLSDYCIPSYTPILQSLINHTRSASPLRLNEAKVLLVAEPDAPGRPKLPQTISELAVIENLLPETANVTKMVGNTKVADVARQLGSTTILHLACHSEQNVLDPLQTGFVLSDGSLKISKLMQSHISQASVAFLSACGSAGGDLDLPDERMHLCCAMMFAGFHGVVGTMWNMDDADGPAVARSVYSELFGQSREGSGDEVSYDVIPRALDTAIRKMRAEGVPAARWATYIHKGV